jgi:DNA polymerase III epsilon subunit-like protein
MYIKSNKFQASHLVNAMAKPVCDVLNHTIRIFYDCETSGAGCQKWPKTHRIIEFAAVAEDLAQRNASGVLGLTRRTIGGPDVLPCGFFSELVYGDGNCTERVTSIHKLTPESIKKARTFEKVWDSFVEFVHHAQAHSPHDSDVVSLIGHNSFSTDNYWLMTELARYGRNIEELLTDGRKLVFEDTYPKGTTERKRLRETLGIDKLGNSAIHKHLKSTFHGQRSNDIEEEGGDEGAGVEIHRALWDAAATRDNWSDPRMKVATTRRTLSEQVKALDDSRTVKSRKIAARSIPDFADVTEG